ncbi:MAG TPA: efflux RND transporter periplasmic adaptor subunit [Planctomycetaceae bacterium]|nr:efflux RND transporter periplasmic adaptor subunit [Planctomycetaceae bacterium]
MIERRTTGFVIVLMAGGLSSGCGLWFGEASRPDRLQLYGNVDIREVELAFVQSERVTELLVEEGDRVESQQLLAKLDSEGFEFAAARAEAQLETQRQVVARLESGTRPEEIREARAALEAITATADDAATRLGRVRKLHDMKVATREELDDAEATANTTAAQQKSAQAALDLAIAGPRKEDILEAKAALKGLEAALSLARRDLKNASLLAPSDGIIRNRILQVGDMASPQKPVFTVALVDPVWVRAYVSETDLGRIWPGMKATISTDAFPDKTYDGWVGFISPTAEFTPRQVETPELRTRLVYQVRVFAANPQNELRLGMPATVHIDLGQLKTTKEKNDASAVR